MGRGALRSAAIIVMIAIASSAARTAHASDPNLAAAELATARALFDEGLAREDAKDWAGALERFKRVSEIKVTPQVLYNMALCYDRLGKTATADTFYGRVIEKGGPPDLVKLATSRRTDLKASIPEVVLDGPKEGRVTVTLDGAAATLGVAIAIDPGKHEVVSRRGADAATTSFDAPPTSGKIRIAVPVPAAPPSPPPPPPPAAEHPFPVLAYVTGGLTLVAAGVGVYGVIARGSAISDADKACGGARDHCPPSEHATVDRISTMSTVTNIGFGAAIVAALATGAIVYFGWVRPKAASSASAFQLSF